MLLSTSMDSHAGYSPWVYHEYLPAKCESLLENGVNNAFSGFDSCFLLCILFTSLLFLSVGLFANPLTGKDLRMAKIGQSLPGAYHRAPTRDAVVNP